MGPFVRLESGLFHAYMTAGGRPASVVGSVGMRDGVVWSKGLEVNIETYWSYGDGLGEYTLIADTHSVPRFHRYGSENLQLRLHPDYEIGRPGGCDTCELGWSHFTPYAASTDVRRLMQLDLSCLTRIRPCLDQSDIMPAAWGQYLAEVPHVDEMIEHPSCSSSIIETLGRDAPNVVSGEIVRPETANKRAQIRLLEKLKGVPNWKVGNTYEMGLPDPTSSAVPRNSRFVFFFDHPNLVSDGQVDRGGACSLLPLYESNMENVHRGIDQDYTATDLAP